MQKKKERFAHCSTLIIPLPWPSPLTVILKDMMLYHPVSLVLLVQEVQGFPIEREIRIVNLDRYLPAPGVYIRTGVCVCPGMKLILGRRVHVLVWYSDCV